MENRNFFNKKDLIAVVLIFVVALCLFFGYKLYNKGEGKYAQVIYDGQIIKEFPLDKDTEYIPKINENIIIEIKDNKVRFKHSDCPDKICINTGWLSQPGQTAVCLPNKMSVIIKAEGNDENNVDTAI